MRRFDVQESAEPTRTSDAATRDECPDCGCDRSQGKTRSVASVQPWQRPLLAFMDKLAKNRGSSVRWHIGRKREGIVVVDKDGKVIE